MTEFFASELWTGFLWPIIIMVAQSLLLLVLLLIAIAYILLADRKIWAAVQIRRGPNVVGPWGLLQSFADLLKFVLKEPTIPDGANKGVFLLAPLVSCVLALAAWAVIPVNLNWVIADINVGILYISHDLSLVRRLCTRVIVMYDGNIVETGDVEQVFTHPREEYTQRLIAAIPTREKRYV